MNRIKALYRGWGIPCTGTQVYGRRHREQWLQKIISRLAYAAAPSCFISSWMDCRLCGARCEENS